MNSKSDSEGPGSTEQPLEVVEITGIELEPADREEALVERLQEELAKERDGRRADRFYAVAFAVIFVDLFAFQALGVLQAVVVGLLEAIVLASFARYSGLSYAAELFDSLRAALTRRLDGSNH